MRWGKWISTLALLMLCVLLVSCSGEQVAAEPDAPTPSAVETDHAEERVIPFRITWKSYSGRGEAIQAIVDLYNEQSDNTVVLTDGDEDRTAVEALLKSDTNTVFVLPYRFVQYLGALGYLKDLTDVFADVQELFYPAVWELASVDGKTYGIPWLGHAMCLLYNKKLLERAGVEPESIVDMDSFLRAIEFIEDTTGARGLGLVGAESNDLSWMINQFIYGYGSSLVSEDGKTVTVNNNKAALALHTYRDVLGPHAQPTWLEDTAVEVQTAFRNQEIAFEILGIWGVTDVIRNGSPFEVGILPLSTIGLCSEVGPLMLAVSADIGGQERDAAYDFLRFLISKDAQEAIMKGEYSPEHDTCYPFRTQIRIDMEDSRSFTANPEYRAFIEGFETPSIDVPVPAWQIIKDEIYAPGLHQVMLGETTIEAFLRDVEIRGNSILKGE